MNKVLIGDVREKLLEVPDGSIQCCVTSPPYWGLRDYGTPPLIWPDRSMLCETHSWNEVIKPAQNGMIYSAMQDRREGGSLNHMSATRKPNRSDVCIICGAWRGSLGLEPTPELYVAHIVDTFRQVRRVLKDDGTLWLNLGDSYASGKGTCYNPGGGNGSLGKNRKEAGVHPLDRGNKSTLAMSGLKPKDLVGIPWMVAFALRADGWYLRSDIIWHKPNPMPESVEDRPTRAHEYLFLLTKSSRYYYDSRAIKEPAKESSIKRISQPTFEQQEGGGKDYRNNGTNANRSARNTPENFKRAKFGGNKAAGYGTRLHSGNEDEGRYIKGGVNKRDVWTMATKPFKESHFATFPPGLIEPCIKAGSKDGDTVLDPFVGSGTTLEVAERLGRNSIGIELNEEYVREIIEPRMAKVNPLFAVAPITSTNGT